ncbi:MAG: glycosyltransferase [Cyanobacteria bacterium P01_B01_bin.77]
MNVSIVIPAYNAAETIEKSVASLQAQTIPNWEVIIVNDGSNDKTETIVERLVAQDRRIHLVNQTNQGVSAARNTGINQAQYDWLGFLDADDWLDPQYLERMTAALAADPNLDAVHCGMRRIDLDGKGFVDNYAPEQPDLFHIFAQRCPFGIHCCIFRKRLAQEIGGFDTSLLTAEDWDFWQRLARTGVRFGAIKEILAFYRMRPQSLSRGDSVFADAVRVITQGHGPDPRVSNPHPDHITGEPPEAIPKLKFKLISWYAAFWLSRGEDARHLLELLGDDHDPTLAPTRVAHHIFKCVANATCQQPAAWQSLWPKIGENIQDFLQALEVQSQATGVARRSQASLEHRIIQSSPVTEPLSIGKTYAVRVEITQPVPDIASPPEAECFYCVVTLEGTELGYLELPIWSGGVSSWLLKDAIAAKFAWPILSRFFERTLNMPKREASQKNKHSSQKLAESEYLPTRKEWKIFLQQLWGKPNWSLSDFYNPTLAQPNSKHQYCKNGHLIVEISEELPDIETTFPEIDVVLTVGESPLGAISVSNGGEFISAQRLRVSLIEASEFELCRVAVREGLLGQAWDEQNSLRSRLVQAAKAHAQSPKSFTFNQTTLISPAPSLLPTVILGNRNSLMGTSASRRSILPVTVASELIEMAQVMGETVMQFPSPSAQPKSVIYAPELLVKRQYSMEANGQWHGAQPKQECKPACVLTHSLPVLMYHRVAPTGSVTMQRYRLTPEAFEVQLKYLRDANFYSVDWQDWQFAVAARRPLPGKAIAITFDDGYLDFLEYTWPLLKQYGFTATVFLVSDCIGKSNQWDAVYGEVVPLMGWHDILQLQDEGVEFGSHTVTHSPLTALSHEKVVWEGTRSRRLLSRQLGKSIQAFAYPYGDYNPIVQHLIGACGYTIGVSCRHGLNQFDDDLLALRRIEVMSSDSFQDFVAKFNA